MKELRYKEIMKLIESQDKVEVQSLAESLNVAPETIRRDLTVLENDNKLMRVHGGAISYEASNKELSFENKLKVNINEKQKIAKKAVAHIKSGDMIVVDGGTTTVHIPQYLNNIDNVNFVTNSISFANEFNLAIEEGRISGSLIMLPGQMYTEQNNVKGIFTIHFLENFSFDKSFISCGGLSNQIVTEYDLEEAQLSKMMMKQSRVSYLLADSSKYSKGAPYLIDTIDNFTEIITEV